MILKTITFNIHHGQGIDEIIDVKRQAELLKQYNPDVIFLQEIDMYTQRVGDESQLDIISNYTGLYYRTIGINIRYRKGFYGTGILSRFPVEYCANFLTPQTNISHEQRGILYNKISFGTTKLHLFCVHLSTYKDERLLALEELLKVINKINKKEIIIVGGDFNVGITKIGNHKYEFVKEDKFEEYNILGKKLNKITNFDETWFSENGSGCIDTIFYSNNVDLKNIITIDNDYSDHYAVYAEFDI